MEGHARRTPHRTALCLYFGEAFQLWSYADLWARALRWGERLAETAGPQGRGEVAFVVLPHGVDLYAAFIGAMAAGLLPSMLPPPQVRQDREAWGRAQSEVIARTRPACIVAGSEEREALGEALAAVPVLEPAISRPAAPGFRSADPDPHAAALLQHSSGTTGLKKGVVLSFGQVDQHVGMLAEALGACPDDVWASWLPLYHDMGLVAALLTPLSLGAGVIALDPFAWVADPMSFFRAVARHRATLAWAPNFAFAHWARTRGDHPAVDASSLRALVDCSEPCRPETLARFAAAFSDCGITPGRLACCYGMAEVVFAATQTRPGAPPRTLTLDAEVLERRRRAEPVRLGRRVRALLSCGPPLPGVSLRIDAPEGAVGEILVRSPTSMSGYHGRARDPDAMAGGWRRSGDVGLLHGGELFVCGRLKEMLILHGRNLYAGDVEAVASSVSGVKPGRAAALGLPDGETGTEELAILLEPLQGAEARAVEAAVGEAVLGAFGVRPRHVVAAPAGVLAKSTAGKMSRADNLERLTRLLAQRDPEAAGVQAEDVPLPCLRVSPAGPLPATASPHPRTPVDLVAQALGDCFGVDPGRVGPETGPADTPGWDSLGQTVLLLRLEALAGVRLGEASAEARTVGDLAALLGDRGERAAA